MNLFQKAKKAYNENGLQMSLLILGSRFGLVPQNSKTKWKLGIKSEIRFWDSYFRTKGLQWSDTYKERFDTELPMQPRPAELLAGMPSEVHILDVGAGPLTFLGKKSGDKKIQITAIDPLADEYDKILKKYDVHPPVRTRCLSAEDIKKEFSSDSFDLAVARNCIDHAYNPEIAICNMIDVVKSGSYVLLEHRENEAENENWEGLHQWNFSVNKDGDFMISSKTEEVNMTKKYADTCTITCEIVNDGPDGDWLVTRILKL